MNQIKTFQKVVDYVLERKLLILFSIKFIELLYLLTVVRFVAINVKKFMICFRSFGLKIKTRVNSGFLWWF